MDGSQPKSRRKPLLILSGFLITIACLWWAFSRVFSSAEAWQQFLTAFRTADYRTLPLIWLTLFFFYWLKAWRWRLLLSPIGSYRTLQDLVPPIMIGFAFNNVLPARLGEVARCFVFSKQQKLPLSLAVSSVVLERFFDLIGILFFLGLGLLLVDGLDPDIRQRAMVPALLAVGGMLGGLTFVIWTRPVLTLVEFLLGKLPFVPGAVVAKVCRILENGAQGLASLRNWRLLATMLVISIVKWGLNGLLVMFSLISFGLPSSPLVAMVVMGVVAFGVSIPSSPGYFGVMQVCFLLVLGLFVEGESGAAAILAASIYYQMTQYIPVTLIGLGAFWFTGLRMAEVPESKSEAQSLA